MGANSPKVHSCVMRSSFGVHDASFFCWWRVYHTCSRCKPVYKLHILITPSLVYRSGLVFVVVKQTFARYKRISTSKSVTRKVFHLVLKMLPTYILTHPAIKRTCEFRWRLLITRLVKFIVDRSRIYSRQRKDETTTD